MATKKECRARLAKVMQIVKLGDDGAIANQAEAEALVKQRLGASHDGAQMLVAQAARRLRYERGAAAQPLKTLSIPEATALAQTLAESGEISKAPGESAIRRAALLGQIAAEQDGGRRWRFQRQAFEAWLRDAQRHRPGRKVKAEDK